MQIQLQISRRIGNKEYEKFMIVVAPKIIRELKWKQGDKLDPRVEEGELRIKLKNANTKNTK